MQRSTERREQKLLQEQKEGEEERSRQEKEMEEKMLKWQKRIEDAVEKKYTGETEWKALIEAQQQTIKDLKDRFFPTGKMFSDSECQRFIDNLVVDSYNNWRTGCYDNFQYHCQGIL